MISPLSAKHGKRSFVRFSDSVFRHVACACSTYPDVCDAIYGYIYIYKDRYGDPYVYLYVAFVLSDALTCMFLGHALFIR